MYFNINSTGLPVSFEAAIANEDSPVTSKKNYCVTFSFLLLSLLTLSELSQNRCYGFKMALNDNSDQWIILIFLLNKKSFK